MTKIATFSNGYADIYKGKRPVRAAWMVILPNGKIVSGHSLDRAKAQKTAEGNAMICCPDRPLKMVGCGGRDILTPAFAKWAHGVAKEAGFADRKAYNAAAEAKREAWRSACKIEVVDL
jgi:hypothetical protein